MLQKSGCAATTDWQFLFFYNPLLDQRADSHTVNVNGFTRHFSCHSNIQAGGDSAGYIESAVVIEASCVRNSGN